jgi:phosphatidylserine/phosphatidylglycerophosphate/cardiolipin synthase-like enzyme
MASYSGLQLPGRSVTDFWRNSSRPKGRTIFFHKCRLVGTWLSPPTRFHVSSVPSRVIVVDPYGPHPIIITGSHGFGVTASRANDENFVIIEGAPESASPFAAHIARLYDHYRPAYLPKNSKTWQSRLDSTEHWQDHYFTPEARLETNFWLGATIRQVTAERTESPETSQSDEPSVRVPPPCGSVRRR